MQNGLFYLYSLDRSINFLYKVSGWFSLIPPFVEISVFKANSVDIDQMLQYAVSDLGLHCLPMSL